MIFLVLGTQKFQLNRLLIQVDELISNGLITQEVVAQIGNSDYKPLNFRYFRFLDKERFDDYISRASIIVSHSGVGTIITALKAGKPVVVFPRLKKYGEHVDNHQLNIAKAFEKKNYVLCCYEHDSLKNILDRCNDFHFETYISGADKIIDIINEYLKTH